MEGREGCTGDWVDGEGKKKGEDFTWLEFLGVFRWLLLQNLEDENDNGLFVLWN